MLSCVWLWDPMDCSTPGFPVHHQLLELTQTHVHWVGDTIQPSHLLSSPSPPTFNLSQHQGLFKWHSSSHQVDKVLAFSASTSVLPINSQDWFSFRMDWLDLLAVHGTLKSLLQHHSSKASILQHSAFFTAYYIVLLKKEGWGAFPGGSRVKNSPATGDMALIPGLKISHKPWSN